MRVIFGGTFDPVHIGHLRLALEVRTALGVDAVHLLPAGDPPHRSSPVASARHRLAMVQLAVQGEPGLVVDAREVHRAGPSYMVDTLAEIRAEVGGDTPLALVVGQDAFAGLDRWHRWLEIPSLAHIIVLYRPGHDLPIGGAVGELLAARKVMTPAQLSHYAAGMVLPLCLTGLDISSTRIRADLARGVTPRFLVPDAVLAYIHQQGLYPPGRES